MFRSRCLFVALVAALFAAGCGSSVKEEVIEVKPSNDPLFQARATLQRYANGQPLSSEVTGFPAMVAEVRKSDPDRAEILEKGLDEIQKAPPAARPAIAKELLGKLQPSMK